MKVKHFKDYTAYYDIPYMDKFTEHGHDKFVTDLFVPSHARESFMEDTEMYRKKSPLVLFVHGGGWRRGDKAAWRHFVRLDINLFAAFFYRVFNLYENIGVAMAKRGIACAVMSYPLTTLQSPWIIFELLVSYLSSVTFLGIVFGLLLACSMVVTWPFSSCIFGVAHDTTLPISLLFGPDTLLVHLLITNLCILVLITLQCRDYRLKPGHVLSMWVMVVFCYTAFTCINIKHSLLLFYFITLILSQGILVTCNLRQQSQTPRDQVNALVKCLKMLMKMGSETEMFNPDIVFLMGHSAGGHLCSLTVLDDQTTDNMGFHKSCIKGVMVISGVLHVEKLDKGPIGPLYLHPSFGNDVKNWRELCPLHTLKLQPSFVPRFLLVTAEMDYHLKEDAKTFSEELQTYGAEVETLTVKNTGHLSIVCYFDRNMGGVNLADKCAKFVRNNC